MKPLFHPALADITVEGIMHALSDPVRAAIYAELADAADALTCSTFLTVRDRDIPKSTLSQHFKTLREAGLILSERQGVEMKSISRQGDRDPLPRADPGDHERAQDPVNGKEKGRCCGETQAGRLIKNLGFQKPLRLFPRLSRRNAESQLEFGRERG